MRFASTPEADLLALLRQAADWGGWLRYHTHDSRRSEPGFPDLVLIRRDRLLAVEVKRRGGKATEAQKTWLAAFGGVEDVESRLVVGDSEVGDLADELLRRPVR